MSSPSSKGPRQFDRETKEICWQKVGVIASKKGLNYGGTQP